MIKEYNTGVDYMDLCIQFEMKKERTNHRYEHWKEIYKNIDDRITCKNEFWYNWLLREFDSYKMHAKINDALAEYETLTNQNPVEKWAFITVGFNPQTITEDRMKKACKKIRDMDLFEYCDNVLEKHRENGIHYHSHYLVKIKNKEYYYTSKIVDKIFRLLSGKYTQDLVLNKACIDVKGPCNKKQMHANYEKYYDYVRGIKKEEKLKYVAMDDEWRQLHAIEKLYIKE